MRINVYESQDIFIKIMAKFFLFFTLERIPRDCLRSILKEFLWYPLDRFRRGIIGDTFVPEGITIKSMSKILTYRRRQPRKR